MRQDMIRALYVTPGNEPEIIEFKHDIKEMQRLVGGLIQPVYAFEDDGVIVCNDEGKLLGMPLNRGLYDETGKLYDIIAGDFFICRAPVNSEDFESLTEDQIEKYMDKFRYPEAFRRTWNGIEAVKIKPHAKDFER